MILSSVDLPQPLLPTMTKTSPRHTSKLTFSKTMLSPKRCVRFLTERMGVFSVGSGMALLISVFLENPVSFDIVQHDGKNGIRQHD